MMYLLTDTAAQLAEYNRQLLDRSGALANSQEMQRQLRLTLLAESGKLRVPDSGTSESTGTEVQDPPQVLVQVMGHNLDLEAWTQSLVPTQEDEGLDRPDDQFLPLNNPSGPVQEDINPGSILPVIQINNDSAEIMSPTEALSDLEQPKWWECRFISPAEEAPFDVKPPSGVRNDFQTLYTACNRTSGSSTILDLRWEAITYDYCLRSQDMFLPGRDMAWLRKRLGLHFCNISHRVRILSLAVLFFWLSAATTDDLLKDQEMPW